MKVLLVADFYDPYIGGVEQHVRTLAHALVRHGHSVAVATQATPATRGAPSMDGGVRVHRLASTAERVARMFTAPERPWAPPIPDPELALGLYRVVRRERPDVVHAHDWMGRSAWAACLRFRVPLVVSLHYFSRSCAKKSRQWPDGPCPGPTPGRCLACSARHYGPTKGVVTFLGNRIGAAVDDRLARQLIAVSNATAEGNGVPTPSRSCVVVPNMVPDELPPAEDTPSGLPDGPFALYVGDLRPEKGAFVLVEAVRRIGGTMPVVLVGESVVGHEIPDLPGLVKLGRLPNATVRRLWQQAYVGVVPSVWAEPFGIVVLEAMAAGCPVIASRIGGLPEVVADGVTGVLVEPDDPGALADALVCLARDDALRERLAAGARREVPRYSADRCAADIEDVYRAASQSTSRRRRAAR
jgi:glycosyltransferase involved in cell wall biosynthesis